MDTDMMRYDDTTFSKYNLIPKKSSHFATKNKIFVSRKFDAVIENKNFFSKRFESASRKFVSVTENKIFLNKFLIDRKNY